MARNKELTRALGGGIFSVLATISGRILFGVGMIVLGLVMLGLLATGKYQALAIVGGAWLVIALAVAYWSR